MGLEAVTWVNDLVPSNPSGADFKSQGDDHLRNIKTALKNSFPNSSRALYLDSSVANFTFPGPVNLVAADASKVIPVHCGGGAITVNLPANATLWDGWQCRVVKVDNSVNGVTIDGNGADTINGQTTLPLSRQYQAFDLVWCTALSQWLGFRAESADTIDGTLAYSGNTLQRAALTGAVVASAGLNATTMLTDLVVVIGDGVNVISTGTKGYVPTQMGGIITGWVLVADASGSCVLDVWKTNGTVPVNANSIAGTEKPTLAAAQLASDLSLSTWATSISPGDIFGFEVESATTVKQVTLSLRITKIS